MQLAGRLAPGAVDHAATPRGRPLRDLVGPTQHVPVLLHLQELAGAIELALRQGAVPGPNRHGRDAVFVACHVTRLRQMAVEDIELALDLHRIAVDRVFHLRRRIRIEMAEAAAQEGRAAQLPEQPGQPGQAFGPRRAALGQEGAELVGQVHHDRARLEHPHRLRCAALRSMSAGILELGLTATKPLPSEPGKPVLLKDGAGKQVTHEHLKTMAVTW